MLTLCLPKLSLVTAIIVRSMHREHVRLQGGMYMGEVLTSLRVPVNQLGGFTSEGSPVAPGVTS